MHARPLAYAFEIPEKAGKKTKSREKIREEPEVFFVTQKTAPVSKKIENLKESKQVPSF